jgi:hypothetical protein
VQIRLRSRALAGIDRRALRDALANHVRAAAVVRGDPQTNRIKPGSELGTPFELGQLAVNRDEHLLGDVFHVGLFDAEVAQCAYDVLSVLIEDRSQTWP